jgi:hypothetical protein
MYKRSVIPALRRLRQGVWEFKTSRVYIDRPYLQKKKGANDWLSREGREDGILWKARFKEQRKGRTLG